MLLPALILPQARGALVAAILPMLFLVDKLRYDAIGWRIRLLVGTMALIATIVFMQRGLASAHMRLDYWYDTVMAFTWLGSRSWLVLGNIRRPCAPHLPARRSPRTRP